MKRATGLIILFLSVIPLNITAQSLSGVNITGTPNIGSSLTGNYTGDLGATGDHYKYEWRYSPARTLLSSTTTSYTIQAADNAKRIYFIVYILDASNAVLVKDSSSTVLVNSIPIASSLSIVGDPRPGLTIWATYYFYDADGNTESGSAYQWYTDTNADGIGASPIFGATSKSYKVKDGDAGKYLGFSVIPGTASGSTPGDTVTIGTYLATTANDPPVVQGSVTITGGLNINDVLTGLYTYSDYEGDVESGSSYEWSTSTTSGGTYTPISEAGISHKITMLEQGLFFRLKVVPHAATGSNSTTGYTSAAKGPSNSKPKATGVIVSGTAAVGQTLTASYTFSDPDAGDNIDESIKQWYRGNQLITGAGYPDYTVTSEDVDSLIIFKVTPVSGGPGYPDTGDPVSVSKGPVTDPLAGAPIAKNLCICGYRAIDSVLIGNYTYQNSYSEKNSILRWYRGNDIVQEGNNSSYKYYTVQAADMESSIRFAVIPRNRLGTTGSLVYSDSLAFFDMPRVVFSVSDSAQELKARPVGGTFSGAGVSNGMFDPGIGVGTYAVEYVLPINKPSATCAQITTQNLEVKPLTISFSGIRPRYCDGDGPDLITVHKVPPAPDGWGFFINDTTSSCLVPVTDSTALFYSDRLRSGDKIDRMVYVYVKIVYFPFFDFKYEVIEQPLVVDHIGTVSILNPEAGAEFCSDTEPVFISTSHTGGTFTGPVTDGKLDPALMPRGYGDTTIVYTYTSALGCSKTVSIPVTINAVPTVSFIPADTCILNDADITKMVNNSARVAGVDSITVWDWKFYDNNINYPRTGFEPSYPYKKGGTHQITLTATTAKGCSKTRVETFNFCRKPIAGFTWLNECFTPGGYIQFFDATDSTSALLSRRWIFNIIDTIYNQYKPKYPHSAPGYMAVKYLVNTGVKGCDDSISRDVYIRPKITVPKDGTLEEFKKGNGGWVKDYESRNSWTFGKPGRTVIKSAHSGDTAWYTGFDIDTQAVESSSVVSPCYDFTNIVRPMISMWLYKRFDRNRDGAALQYKIGDLGTWEYVGSLEDGIRWFNSADIKGRPGGDLVGWTSLTSQDTKWSESRHKIDELAGKTDVRFRIAYGSDGLAAENDGVAFDDVWIGERTRSVLLEHFSNTSSLRSSEVTDVINTITENYKKDVINIQYHTNFPGSDPYYSENPGDASARILYYGLIKSPYSFIDGGYNRDMFATISDYNLSDIDSLNVNRRSLINPKFYITINSVITGGVLTTGGQIRAIENLNADNLTLYLAVTEKQNNDHTGALGETAFYNVFRKFIPDAGGINLKKTWTKGETFTMAEQSWVINNIKSNADIEVIAFLQNNVTKEIYQAASTIEPDIVIGIESIKGTSGNVFAIYPNPAVNKITLAFREPLSRNAEIRIYDIRGVVVSTWKAEAGKSEFTIDDTGLNNGVYLVRVSSGGIDLGFRKLVVAGR